MYCLNCCRPLGLSKVCPHCGSTHPPVDHPLRLPPGVILNDRYLVGKELKRTGFGIFYLGVDLQSQERVWIKEFFPKAIAFREGDDHAQVKVHAEFTPWFESQQLQFLKDAQVLCSKKWPYLIEVLDFLKAFGTAYKILSLPKGMQVLKQDFQWPESEVLSLGLTILKALEPLHKEKIWHLDLQPGNFYEIVQGTGSGDRRLLVGDLLDFCEIPLQDQGFEHLYKPSFFPMEQLWGQSAKHGPWTDLHAWGATLYYLLTATMPTHHSAYLMHGEDLNDPRFFNASLSDALAEVVMWCLEVRPEDRPQSVHEVLHALQIGGLCIRDHSSNRSE